MLRPVLTLTVVAATFCGHATFSTPAEAQTLVPVGTEGTAMAALATREGGGSGADYVLYLSPRQGRVTRYEQLTVRYNCDTMVRTERARVAYSSGADPRRSSQANTNIARRLADEPDLQPQFDYVCASATTPPIARSQSFNGIEAFVGTTRPQ